MKRFFFLMGLSLLINHVNSASVTVTLPYESKVFEAIANITRCLGDQADKYQYTVEGEESLFYYPKEMRAFDRTIDARLVYCLLHSHNLGYVSCGASEEYEAQFDWSDQSSTSEAEYNTRWNDWSGLYSQNYGIDDIPENVVFGFSADAGKAPSEYVRWIDLVGDRRLRLY